MASADPTALVAKVTAEHQVAPGAAAGAPWRKQPAQGREHPAKDKLGHKKAKGQPRSSTPRKNMQKGIPALASVMAATPAVARTHPGYQQPPADKASVRILRHKVSIRLRTLDAYYSRSAAAGIAPNAEASAEVAMLKFALFELSPI